MMPWRRVWPVAALSLLAGMRWVLDAVWPASASTLASACAACALLACVCGVRARRSRSRMDAAQRATAFLCGVGLLAAPALGAVLRGAAAEGFDRVVALCFAPVFVVLICGTHRSDGLDQSQLWAALAVLAGALLVFALETPRGVLPYVELLLPVLAAAAAVVAAPAALRACDAVWPAAAWIFAGAACGLGVLLGVAHAQGQSMALPGWSLAPDACVLALAVYALCGVPAEAYAARWAWTPAVTVLSALAIERPGLEPRALAGCVLLLGGGWLLARSGTRDAQRPLVG